MQHCNRMKLAGYTENNADGHYHKVGFYPDQENSSRRVHGFHLISICKHHPSPKAWIQTTKLLMSVLIKRNLLEVLH